ncbi:outer kinetochore KNL1 complex subunit KNL1 isoform X1 [Microcebus murinus]|uniref:outer kinetochore KNL1 complex subunit KNL1 isoform X1 n=2 Tax=Microcebus murinus TaxID=30608 RepID=UPI003F6C275D
MDGVPSETNEENDNIERPIRRRRSSILKPPRSPLQDLRGGNEIVQESNALRSKKNSRRVSFADTIKVFQTEPHMKIVRKSEMAETEAGENVLFIQNKNLEDNYCEITGMNTLLCAPIQTQMPQKEFSIIEHNHERIHRNDQTVIFSDENQMDLTACHTVMITKGLLDSTKSEKSTKIDTTSFLANLKLHTEDSRMKTELNFPTTQNTSEKKINFNDFIKRLKARKYNASPSTGPDKENFEVSIYSKESNSASSTHQVHAPLNVDENSSNITRIFREQDDGMNFTQCHTANIQTLIPTSSEANLQEFKGNDITIYGNDFMDLTVNHTIQILPSAGNLSEIESQTQNVTMDVTTGYRTKALGKKTVFKNKPNTAFQDPSLNPEDKIHSTRSHVMEAETYMVTQTSNQDARILAMTPESICSSPATQGYKTVFYSSCNDAMELTKCLSSMREEKNLLKHDNNSKMYPNPDATSLLTEKTIYSGEDNMDITKSHTIAIDNHIFKQDQTNVQMSAAPISEKEMILQNHITMSEDGQMNVNCHISKERFQQSLENPLSISLTDKKTQLLAGEDMDLTEGHTSNLGNQVAFASYNLATKNTSQSHSHKKSPSDEGEKMTKVHIEPSQQPNIISKNILTDTWNKEKDQVLKISPCLDKDSPQSADCNQDIATSHNIVYCGGLLDKQVALGNNRNTTSCEQSLFSTTKLLFSSEEQSAMNNHNTAVNSHTVKSVLGQCSKLPEPLGKNLLDPTPDCFHDQIICSEEEHNMDLTKSHTVVIGFSSSEEQELGKTGLEHTTSQLTTVNRQIAVNVEKCDKGPIEKTGVFTSHTPIDVSEDESVQKPGFLKKRQNVKICGRKSVGRLKIDETIVFSEGDKNDMDITKSYTVEINHRPLLDKYDAHLVPLAGTSKTVLYTCGQDDMEITTSHTTALECKTISPDEIITRPMDKTVLFVDNHDELEMTKSNTVFIDYQAKERTVLLDKTNFELSHRKSLEKTKVILTPTEESVFFPENDDSDHPASKDRQLTYLDEFSNIDPIEKAVSFIADDNMEVPKSATWKNVKDVQKPECLNEPLSGKSQRRKSLRLKNDKTIAFSGNDKNDIDIAQSCMVKINNKSALEDREDLNLVPVAGTSKTILYSSGQDDMEITRSHTTALECKTVSPGEITRPMDKTVMFVDNHNELEVTKSHTVFIDCQATEKIFQEYPKFGTAKGKNLGVSFPRDANCVQEITKKQALAVENKIVLHTDQKHHMMPFVPSNKLCGDQSEIEIIKSHNTAVDEEVIGKVVDQAHILVKAKIESCHLDTTDGRNVEFTSSHATALCGSCDNCSGLPNVIACTDNLESSIMSLCDKNKEKAKNCPVQTNLAYANNLASEYYLKSKVLPVSAPCSSLENEEVIQTNTKRQLDGVITLLKDQDLIKEPPNLLANKTLIYSQDLGEMTKLNSKRVSFKLPKDQMEAFVDDVCVTSQPPPLTQQPPLPQKAQSSVNKDEVILSKAGNKSLNIGNSSPPTQENKSKMLNNEKQFAIACKKELKENIQIAKCNTVTDFHSNSDLTKQIIQTHANAREASDPVIASNVPCFSSFNPNLNNFNGKTEEFLDFQTDHIAPPPEQLLELGNKAHNDMSIVQATEIHNVNIVSSNAEDYNRDEENKKSHNGTETTSVPLKTVVKDKMRRCSLGIFLPRLPNKRNCSVTGIDDLEQISADTTGLNQLETQPVSSKDAGIEDVAAKLNLSPSQYINEENLPIYPDEINSSDSISIETEEKALIKTYQKEISPSENKMEETFNSQKRTWVQEEDDDIQNEKKIRKNEIKLRDTTQDLEIFDHHTEGDIDKSANSVLIKSPSRTPSSCSSSLDSIKADGTSLDFSTCRNSQMESQFLTDTTCEESLREKLKDGRITIREFFILLQVHILIQKPRQSNLPANFAINTPPTPEDLMLSQYVYRPKIQIYKEDCETRCQKIEELKLSALNQDKLLADINRSLWEKMRHYSDEQLKAFGIYLNKIKSRFTKMTKVFTHQGKVALYGKLAQSAQNEREKLQIRIDEMDNILKKINNCLTEVEIETKNLENEDKDNPMEEGVSEIRVAEKELEQLKTEEEELQRNLLELEVQKEQTLAQIDFLQKQTKRTEELLDQLSLSEWDIIEWSDDQAVFTFVYDTVELTISFGESVVGCCFLEKPDKKIVDMNFQSLLDEDKAPPSSILVHKLIFQYIKEQESWKKKCTTQHEIPKMLQELSMAVNHCRLLGEEIEFLKRWGPNYNLMNIDVNNTELKLLFCSSAAFAKFEITFSLSAHYPSVPLPFTIQNHLGNIGQDEIAPILSKVPPEDNYLKNVVKQIYQDLLHDCHFFH